MPSRVGAAPLVEQPQKSSILTTTTHAAPVLSLAEIVSVVYYASTVTPP